MNRKFFSLSVDTYLRVIVVSSLAAIVGSYIVFSLLGDMLVGMPNGIIFVPPSVITWIILVHFFTRESILRVILIGAISPIVGCLSGMIYLGMGLLWLGFVIQFIWIFSPIGIIPSFLIFFAVRRDLSPRRGGTN
jgi:hypothetical protein